MPQSLMVILCFLLVAVSTSAPAELPQLFSEIEAFLRNHVREGLVDYRAIKKEPAVLQHIIENLARFDAAKIPTENHQQAFWINAYNMLVIHTVVQFFPINSPLEVSGFFNARKHHVAGEKLTLDEIEKFKLLQRFKDPRLHFALVCAAKGCPPIIPEAYRAEHVNAMLDRRARQTLNDPRYVKVDAATKTVYLSEIFKWYQSDFTAPQKSILEYINRYRQQKIPMTYSIDYIPYDWELNQQSETVLPVQSPN